MFGEKVEKKKKCWKAKPGRTLCVSLALGVSRESRRKELSGYALVSVPPREGAHGEQETGALVGGACKLLGCLSGGGMGE